MITVSFTLLVLVAGVESLSCSTGQQPCGTSGCYDPNLQRCINAHDVVQCKKSCNGICYSDSQYCYNNTIVCNNDEWVCNVKHYSPGAVTSLGPTCYHSSRLNCLNNTLCSSQYLCGAQCLNYDDSACANNETICYGFYWRDYHPHTNRYLGVCGPQQECYDTRTSVCLDETTVCKGLESKLCGTNCFNPDTQRCTDDNNIQCIHGSCNGICYSDSQYCYNNTIVCNNGESVCNVEHYSPGAGTSLGPTCYNSSRLNCLNNTLCSSQYLCGTQCLNYENSVCANNETICYGFHRRDYHLHTNRYLGVCGPQQECYDTRTSVCLNGTTVCKGLNSELCGTNCINPNTQRCTDDNNIQCIHDSCNGTCYSNSQYCDNNTIVCNNGERVCNVKHYYHGAVYSFVPTCYNSSHLNCFNDELCYLEHSCGTQCMNYDNSSCVNNTIICYGFYGRAYHPFTNRYLGVCGPQQKCYDKTTSICLGKAGTVCPIGNKLCFGVCYNPQTQLCNRRNNFAARSNRMLNSGTAIFFGSNRNIMFYGFSLIFICLFSFS